MALKISSSNGSKHEFLYLGEGFIPIMVIMRERSPETRLFCVACGKYHTIDSLVLSTAVFFDHRIELAVKQGEASEKETRLKLARDIENYKRRRAVYDEE